MLFGKSWKTSVAGFTALLSALPALFSCLTGGLDWHCISVALPPVLAGLGLIFAKDGNVTGGTVAATPEAAKRVE